VKFSDISIKWQLLILCLVIVIIPVLVLGFLSYDAAKDATIIATESRLMNEIEYVHQIVDNSFEMMQDKVSSDLNVAHELFYQKGFPYISNTTISIPIENQVTREIKTVSIPEMFDGEGNPLYRNYAFSDKVKSLVGGTATIFQIIDQGALRIATNVLKEDGSRAIGTYIPPSSEVFKTIQKGDVYYGRAFVVNDWYQTAYEPIRDESGKMIGILYVGIKDISETTFNRLSDRIIGENGFVFVIDEAQELLLAEHEYKGKKIEIGHSYMDVLERGKNLNHGETSIMYYDAEDGKHIISFMYLPEWGWIIGIDAPISDFLGALQGIAFITILVIIISLICVTLVAYSFAVFMTRRFNKIIGEMGYAASGDLTRKIDGNYLHEKNEIGKMAHSFATMLVNLRDLVINISAASQVTSTTAKSLSSTSEEVKGSSQSVSITVQQIAMDSQGLSVSANKTRNEIDILVNQINDISFATQTASKCVEEATGAVDSSAASAKKAGKTMEDISETVQLSAKKIEELGGRVSLITDIINVINEISEQTNLLALNAAIEAARAGDAGKGFAVVSEEIRKLAEESQKSTKKIEEIINSFAIDTASAVQTMTKGSEHVNQGALIVEDALAGLSNIQARIGEVAQQINMINKATKEQLEESKAVQESILKVAQIADSSANGAQQVSINIEQTTKSIHEVANAASDLASSAEELERLVGRFKL
jgi:methyl-accepting chemotaxis protein